MQSESRSHSSSAFVGCRVEPVDCVVVSFVSVSNFSKPLPNSVNKRPMMNAMLSAYDWSLSPEIGIHCLRHQCVFPLPLKIDMNMNIPQRLRQTDRRTDGQLALAIPLYT